MASVLASTTITVAGTPTVFLPLPTAWPSGSGCTSNIYLHTPVSNPNTFIAWDPLYGADMVTSAQSCLPSQVSVWWSQPSAAIFTALGPSFQCPEAYSAVQTAVVASSLHQTFCCPSQYSLLVLQANSAKGFPSQCISTVTSGQTFTHLTLQGETGQSTATVVMTTSATVFAIPVNGFDFAVSSSSTASASATSTTSTTSATAETTAHSSTPAGVYAGIVVGVVMAILLAGLAVFLLWRRRRQQAEHGTKTHASVVYYDQPPKELQSSAVYELSGR